MTKEIQSAICKYLLTHGHEHVCENYGHTVFEFDVAALSKAGLISEFEVKISRSDFTSDSKKEWKPGIGKFKLYEKAMFYQDKCPNYFYYCCPAGLIPESEIPPYAGLIYYHENEITIQRNAKRLHSKKEDILTVVKKMLRLHAQRKYLGGSLMTYKNKEIVKIREQNLKDLNDFCQDTMERWPPPREEDI